MERELIALDIVHQFTIHHPHQSVYGRATTDQANVDMGVSVTIFYYSGNSCATCVVLQTLWLEVTGGVGRLHHLGLRLFASKPCDSILKPSQRGVPLQQPLGPRQSCERLRVMIWTVKSTLTMHAT